MAGMKSKGGRGRYVVPHNAKLEALYEEASRFSNMSDDFDQKADDLSDALNNLDEALDSLKRAKVSRLALEGVIANVKREVKEAIQTTKSFERLAEAAEKKIEAEQRKNGIVYLNGEPYRKTADGSFTPCPRKGKAGR